MITQKTANPDKIQQGVFGESCGYGFDHMSKVSYCRDCDWSVTPDDLTEKADSIAQANSLVGSRGEGHIYFHRGHTIVSIYLPFSIHPNPFEDGPSVDTDTDREADR